MNRLKTTALLTLLTLLLVTMGNAIGGTGGMVAALLLAAAMNFGTYWYSDKLVLRMYRAREVSDGEHPEFHDMVRGLAQRAGLPMPRVYIIPSESPNAFATGRNPEHAAVAATEGLLRLLDARELEGVMAHELAHVKNRDTLVSTIAATFAGAISMLANILQFAAIFGGGRNDEEDSNPIAGLALAFIAPIAAMLVQMAVSRSREFLADETGARICGEARPLATALQKLQSATQVQPMAEASPATAHLFIVSPLTGASLTKLFSTHPPVGERVARLAALKQVRR